MNLTKALIISIVLIIVRVHAQNIPLTDLKCDNYSNTANEFYKNRKFSDAVSYYYKTLTGCSSFDKTQYSNLVISLKNSISKQTENSIKQAYIDTIISVYQLGEENGMYDQINDLNYATYILNAKKPDYIQADQLFLRGLNKAGYFSGETFLNLYYSNLYRLFKNTDSTHVKDYKTRLLFEYFKLSEWIQNENMSDQLKSNVALYFNDAFKTCEELVIEAQDYFSRLRPNEILVQKDLVNLQKAIEEKGCTDSQVYEQIIDSLLNIEFTTELLLIKASVLRKKGEFSKEFSSLYFARNTTKDPEIIEKIDFLSAESQYNMGHFNEAYKIAILLKGTHKNEGRKLAAKCVVALADSCGNSPFEKKLNYYYALDLLKSSEQNDIEIKQLTSEIKSKQPQESELLSNGFRSGQEVSLNCWSVIIILP